MTKLSLLFVAVLLSLIAISRAGIEIEAKPDELTISGESLVPDGNPLGIMNHGNQKWRLIQTRTKDELIYKGKKGEKMLFKYNNHHYSMTKEQLIEILTNKI